MRFCGNCGAYESVGSWSGNVPDTSNVSSISDMVYNANGSTGNGIIQSGTFTVYCPTCGKTYTFEITNNVASSSTEPVTHTHVWDAGTITTAATCTTAGVITYKCTNTGCTESKTEEIPATGHKYGTTGEVTTPATCTTYGVLTYTCTNGCGETKTETIPATGHNWNEGTITTPVSCTADGVKTYKCTNSGCTETKTETIPATGHTWDAGKITKSAVLNEDGTITPGEITYTCTVEGCGAVKTEEFKAFEYKISDGSAKLSDIIAGLKKDGQLAESTSFEPIFAIKLTGDAAVTDGNVVTVGAGGIKNASSIRIYDTNANTIDVFVYSDVLKVDSKYTDAEFKVQWNDNQETAKRPAADDTSVTENYELQFSLDGSDEYFTVDQLSDKTGITSAEIANLEIIRALNTNLTAYLDTTNGKNWTFDLKSVGIPKTYTVDGVQHTITYRIAQKNQYNNYTYTSGTTGLSDESRSYAYIGTPILNTLLYEYSAKVLWYDNSNAYKTRPDELTAANFVIYKLTTSSGSKIEALEQDETHYTSENVTVSRSGDSDTVSLTGLPAYDEKGNPVYYAVKVVDQENQDSTTIKAKTYTDKNDRYYPTVYNYDSFSSYTFTDYLFNGGQALELLYNYTKFTYTKVWDDDSDKKNRGAPKIYLYAVSEDLVLKYNSAATDAEKTAALNTIIAQLSAVEGNSGQSIPTSSDKVTTTVSGSLPLYSMTGERLVYLGLEVGEADKYTVIVNNEGAKTALANSDVVDILNNVTADGQVKYVLNGGTIANTVVEPIKVEAEVTMHAAALQSTSESASYLVLERYDPDSGEWVSVTYGDYINGTVPEDKTVDDAVTEKLENIKGENYTVTVESQNLPKYLSYASDSTKKYEVQYRYRETQIDIGNTATGETDTTGAMTWKDDTTGDNDYVTDKMYHTGQTVPGVGSESVDMYLSGTSTVDGYTTKIDNYINAPLVVKVQKSWTVEGINVTEEVRDGYVTLDLYQDGTYQTTAELFGGSDPIWLDYESLDRFDPEGVEYENSVSNLQENDGGFLDQYNEEHGTDYTGWGTTKTISYDVVNINTDTGLPGDNNDGNAVEMVVNIANVVETPSGTITVAAQKEWQDGGDIASEKSSYVALYHVDDEDDDRDSFGLLGVFELDKADAWYKEATIGNGLHDTIYTYSAGTGWEATGKLDPSDYDSEEDASDYIFVEVAIGSSSITWPDSTSCMLHEYNDGTYETWTNDDIWEIREGISRDTDLVLGKIATDESDPYGKSEYSYLVSEKIGTSVIDTECYMITNTRYAEESYDLTKTWADGAEKRAGKFILYKTDQGTTTEYLTITTNGTDSINADGVEVVFSETNSESSTTSNIKINHLPKYDSTGELISYNLKEVAIWDETANDGAGDWVEINSDGSATVAGINYSASCKIDITKEGTDGGTVYGKIHHNNDLTYWAGTNKVTGSYDLNFYKVWYDSGSVIRPNIYFNVYRCSTNYEFKDANGTWNVYKWMRGDYDDDPNLQYKYSTAVFAALLTKYETQTEEASTLIRTVNADKLYDATSSWMWAADIGNVEQYDEDGYPYVYFLVEGGTEDTDYEGNEYYGNMISAELSVDTEVAKAGGTASEIYDIYQNGLYETYKNADILVLSDGYHKDEATDDPGKYYSRTVVNRMSDDRSLSGTKIWNIPEDWTMGESNNPEVTFEVWRTSKDYEDTFGTTEYTAKELKDWFDNTVTDEEMVTTFTLNSDETGAFSFTGNNYVLKYEKYVSDTDNTLLQQYDKYGNLYYYYVVEETSVPGYPDDDVKYNFGTYHTENNYEISAPYIKISGQKTWTISAEMVSRYLETGESLSVKDMSPVTVTLWAQAVTSDGADLAGAEAIKIADVTLDPASDDITIVKNEDGSLTGTMTYSFSEYVNDGNDTVTTFIPYNGPNGVPFKFYVTEETSEHGVSSQILYYDSASETYTKKAYTSETEEAIKLYDMGENAEIRYQNNTTENGKDASFENTYLPETKNASVSKVWSDDYVDNDEYRPDKLVFKVGRYYKDADGTKHYDEKFAPITQEFLKSDNLKKSTWNVPVEDHLKNLDKYDRCDR